jgi:hypothetical protein
MRVADKCGEGRIIPAGVQKCFEAAGRAVEVVDGADLGGEWLHTSSVTASLL